MLKKHESKEFLGKLPWQKQYGVSLEQMCMCGEGEQCIMEVKRLAFWTGCVCVTVSRGTRTKCPTWFCPVIILTTQVGFRIKLASVKKHFNIDRKKSVITGSVLISNTSIISATVRSLFAYWVSYVFMLVFFFLTAGLCCETNIQGRPHTEVSCCQLNWNSPCPGDRAGRQWKPAVIKADRVSGKLRNRSAMSVTKVLAWQWEKYKLSMAQTNANRPSHKHTDKWGKIRCPF